MAHVRWIFITCCKHSTHSRTSIVYYNNTYLFTGSAVGPSNLFNPIRIANSRVDGATYDNNLAWISGSTSTYDLLVVGTGNLNVVEGANNSTSDQMHGAGNDPFVDSVNKIVANGDFMPAGYAVAAAPGAG